MPFSDCQTRILPKAALHFTRTLTPAHMRYYVPIGVVLQEHGENVELVVYGPWNGPLEVAMARKSEPPVIPGAIIQKWTHAEGHKVGRVCECGEEL